MDKIWEGDWRLQVWSYIKFSPNFGKKNRNQFHYLQFGNKRKAIDSGELWNPQKIKISEKGKGKKKCSNFDFKHSKNLDKPVELEDRCTEQMNLIVNSRDVWKHKVENLKDSKSEALDKQYSLLKQ